MIEDAIIYVGQFPVIALFFWKRDSYKYLFPVLITSLMFSFPLIESLITLHTVGSNLIIVYGIMVLEGYFLIIKKKGWFTFEAISISLLLAFFCNFFWEFPIHVIDLFEKGLTPNLVFQFYGANPLVLFWKVFKLKDRGKLVKCLFASFALTAFLTWACFGFSITNDVSFWYNNFNLLYYGIQNVNRLLCFQVLAYVFLSEKVLVRRI